MDSNDLVVSLIRELEYYFVWLLFVLEFLRLISDDFRLWGLEDGKKKGEELFLHIYFTNFTIYRWFTRILELIRMLFCSNLNKIVDK